MDSAETPHRPPRTVVVTGVSGTWGRRVAAQLLERPGVRVLGIDRRAGERPPAGLDFVKADVRNPLLVELLRVEQADTVIHLAFRERQWRREPDFDSNVLGTMELLGACAEAGVRHVVLKSSMAVYGARPDNAEYVPEDWPLAAHARYGYVRDAVEIEQFRPQFQAEYPEMEIAVLRFGHIVGAGVDTPFTRLLRLPVMPQLLGFDPLLQVIDAEDVVAALVHAALHPAGGAFNVAAGGALPLWQVAGLVGSVPVPVLHLLLDWGWFALAGTPPGRLALAWFPLEPEHLRFPCTGDLARMRETLGFEPRWTAREAMDRYVEAVRVERYQDPAELRRYAADRLDGIIQARLAAWQSQQAPGAEEPDRA